MLPKRYQWQKRQLASLNENTLTKLIHHWFGSPSYEVRRSSNILIVSITFPMAQNLNEVIQNTSPCSRSGCPNLATVTWRIASRAADRRIALNLSLSKEQDKGRLFSKRNRGSGRLPRRLRKETIAWTAHKGEPGPSKWCTFCGMGQF